MKKYFFCFCSIGFSIVFAACTQTTYTEKHLNVVLRDIGHHVLLTAHDSTSRVLPIEKIADNTYQISFQNAFAFVPDTLIKVVHNRLKRNFTPTDYIVSMIECNSKKTFFAFEMSSKKENIVACSGRNQPIACYVLQIEFLKEKTTYSNYYWALLILLGFLIFLFYGKKMKAKKVLETIESSDFITIGQTKFFPEKHFLQFNQAIIELSARESKLLKIFAENQNQIIERERLMKEVWEDEGTIVMSRNLDVSISKLRKKFQNDDHVKITNIHAKGYKLEVIGI
jgi:DNA-binding winged helix-turn-helix (wHTH) protein